ncbi:hypothetical protein NA57DRAFT_76883 [Rhizodiscina lignyota]|uniref:Uncharacterized protein n=1 Tax=Rhizodiscina lignyota TaxID=1504668 RepID=A0A9P4IGK2_9PEZI|nr:hypothetical protein NA57DRAFT_76883 [Rhizodiscina lignyota]
MENTQGTPNHLQPPRRVGLPSSPREYLLFPPPSPSATLCPPGSPPTTTACSNHDSTRRTHHKPSLSTSTAATVIGTPQPSPKIEVEEPEAAALWGQQPRRAPEMPRTQRTLRQVQVSLPTEEAREPKKRSGLFGGCFGRKSKKPNPQKKYREPLYLVPDAHWTEL